MTRSIFYVDGFNFYHSRLKRNRQYRWLNMSALADNISDKSHCVERINYYTAYVSGRVDPGAVTKQQAYLKALKEDSRLQVHAGKFTITDRWVKLVHPAEARPRGYTWSTPFPDFVLASVPQEKGSDVKLGSHLIRDAVMDLFDVAYVITNDTDLIEPIRIVTEEIGKSVIIVPPILPKSPRNPVPPQGIRDVSSDYKYIQDNDLASAQFPAALTLASGRQLHKPAGW